MGNSEEEFVKAFEEELCESLHNHVLWEGLGVNPEGTPLSFLMQKHEKEIKKLPQKTREKLCKKYVKVMLNEREIVDWDDIHYELDDTSINDAGDQIIADFNCVKCGMGVFRDINSENRLCKLCKLVELKREAQDAEGECSLD